MLASLSADERYRVEVFVEALRSEQSIDGLTRQQSRLIRVLQSAPGRIFSGWHLSDLIAPDPLDPPEPQVVKVLVCRIRQLRPDLSPHIQTVWGQGLRWIETPTTKGD